MHFARSEVRHSLDLVSIVYRFKLIKMEVDRCNFNVLDSRSESVCSGYFSGTDTADILDDSDLFRDSDCLQPSILFEILEHIESIEKDTNAALHESSPFAMDDWMSLDGSPCPPALDYCPEFGANLHPASDSLDWIDTTHVCGEEMVELDDIANWFQSFENGSMHPSCDSLSQGETGTLEFCKNQDRLLAGCDWHLSSEDLLRDNSESTQTLSQINETETEESGRSGLVEEVVLNSFLHPVSRDIAQLNKTPFMHDNAVATMHDVMHDCCDVFQPVCFYCSKNKHTRDEDKPIPTSKDVIIIADEESYTAANRGGRNLLMDKERITLEDDCRKAAILGLEDHRYSFNSKKSPKSCYPNRLCSSSNRNKPDMKRLCKKTPNTSLTRVSLLEVLLQIPNPFNPNKGSDVIIAHHRNLADVSRTRHQHSGPWCSTPKLPPRTVTSPTSERSKNINITQQQVGANTSTAKILDRDEIKDRCPTREDSMSSDHGSGGSCSSNNKNNNCIGKLYNSSKDNNNNNTNNGYLIKSLKDIIDATVDWNILHRNQI